IPTYDRLEILTETLDTLALQDGFHDADLEIVVSDNASPTDPTPMLRAFEQRHGRPLILHRNDSNKGIDGNIHQVADLATGRYILFMSDDDILLPGTLRKLQALVRQQPDLLFCFMNGCPFRGRFDPARMAPPIIPLHQDLMTRSKDELIGTIGVWSTFVSAFFVKRDAWIGVADRTRFIGTDIYLTHVLFRLLAASPQGLKMATAERLVAARDNFTGSFRIAHAFGLHFMKLLLEDAPALGYSPAVMRAVKRRTLRDTLPSMVLQLRMGARPRNLGLAEIAVLLRYTWWEAAAWTRMMPMVLLPRPVLRGLSWMRRRLRGQATPASGAQA
ncbi:hypothetical protein DBR42_18010, partial [Pelomonas sp. HMWF004]